MGAEVEFGKHWRYCRSAGDKDRGQALGVATWVSFRKAQKGAGVGCLWCFAHLLCVREDI